MKKKIALFTLFCILTEMTLYSQTQISGSVRSAEGALQNVTVEFYDLSGNPLDRSTITDPYGKFKSEKKIAIGSTIKIKLHKDGYQTMEKEYKVDETGDAGEIPMSLAKLAISGVVKDSVTGEPLQGVEISFYEASRRIQLKYPTNREGYFDLETDFKLGDIIRIHLFKDGYFDKEFIHTLTHSDMNILPTIPLANLNTGGLIAIIRITDKAGNPIGGATLRYWDERKRQNVDTIVPANGELLLKIYQQAGTPLDLTVIKPNHRTNSVTWNLSTRTRENRIEVKLERTHKALGTTLLVGGGAFCLVAGGMYLSSQSTYNDYKNFSNYTNTKDRDADYDKAQQKLDIAVGAACVAGAALIGYIIYKIDQKNKEKKIQRGKTQTGFNHFSPFIHSYATGNTSFGIVYQF